VEGRAVHEGSCAELDERWARTPPARLARAAILAGVFGPILAYYTRRDHGGHERLRGLRGPVVFAANHSSHIDTPILLRALPAPWRGRTVVAAAADYFYGRRSRAALVSLLFCTVPMRREGGGSGDLTHVDELLDAGWSVLMYPEGTRRRDGGPVRLRSGAAVLAARHGVPIVPIHLAGTRTAMPPGQVWPRRRVWQPRHPVRVTFGDPITLDDPARRHEAMERIEAFFAAQGGDRPEAHLTLA